MTLRMLFGCDGYARVEKRLAAAGAAIEPVLLHRDGRLTVGDQVTTAGEAGCTVAWLSPELFGLQQDQDFFDAALTSQSLDFFQAGRAGYDDPAFAKLSVKGVRIAMSKGPAPAIGEYVLAQVLDRFQRGPERRAAQAAEQWAPLPFTEVAGSHWVLVGYGEIGREVAIRARAFGAHITGVRRSGGEDDVAQAIVAPDTMGEALAAADVVVLSVPLSSDNDGHYGGAFFAGMAPGALFVNIGRGQLLDEPALREALDAGRPGHAVLDVTRVEPLPPGEWQWRHPGVTLTAHTSGIGSGLLARTDALLVENLARYVAGQPLLHELDPGVFR